MKISFGKDREIYITLGGVLIGFLCALAFVVRYCVITGKFVKQGVEKCQKAWGKITRQQPPPVS